ncbi:MAG TPA: ABC transporter ATP-binding protein [Acidimicrobiia bacterium]
MTLRLSGLRAGYGTTPVLHGVDLVVPPGRAVALLGANGAGKTTLLRTAMGLVKVWGGDVTLDGETVTDRSVHERVRRGMCLIPEGRGIFRQLTVRQNLAMQVDGRDVNRAIEVATGAFPLLGERLGQIAGTLSGGQQQMVAVARALVTEARVVLADELSVGLAPIVVDEIFSAIDLLRGQGRSLLIVEQYVDRALAVADYVYILHKGRVAFVGEPAQCTSHEVFARYMGQVA